MQQTLIMSELYTCVHVCVSTLKINAYIIFTKIIWPAEYLLSIILFAAIAAVAQQHTYPCQRNINNKNLLYA